MFIYNKGIIMTTNIKFKGNKSCYYPLGINEKNGVIPCTRIAQNFTSEEIVKDHEKDSYFFEAWRSMALS